MSRAESGSRPSGVAAARRRHRLFGDRPFVNWLCADVGLQIGPPGKTRSIDEIEAMLHYGFDGVVLSQAGVERFSDTLAERADLRFAVRLDWCGQWRSLSPLDDAVGVSVSSVAQAAESGADAVIQYALLGNADAAVEADYIARAARVVREAHAAGLACILEPLIRGGNADGQERSAAHQIWAVRTATELGADAVKIEAPIDAEAVLEAADVPVLVSSTPPFGDDEAEQRARRMRDAGAAGTAYAADLFGSADPEALAGRLLALR